jgi:cysteine desulfurase
VRSSTYLDYNATTPLASEVLEAMLPFLRESFGNPSSIHSFGRDVKGALIDARESIAESLSAAPREIVVTGGGTEADNLAILSVVAKGRADANPRRHIVTSTIEHHAVLHPVQFLEKQGFPVSFVEVDEGGRVSVESVSRAVRDDTLLVSIMTANNETGVVQPIPELAQLAHAKGALFHTDAVQACGKIPVNVSTSGVDLLSLSAHKFCGPKGVGVLYVKQGTAFQPVFRGGGQERSRRPGTENPAGIVGLAAALRLATAGLSDESARLTALRDELERDLLTHVPGVHVNGAADSRTPNTSNLRFDDVDGESLVLALDREGFAVSTGAACSSGSVTPSHVLLALGLAAEQVQGSIRVSLGRDTRESDVSAFAGTLKKAVATLRATPATGQRSTSLSTS